MITAAQVLPAGTVYAIFVGLGTAGTVIAEILFFGEAFRWGKVLLILLLLVGVIGLKLVTDDEHERMDGIVMAWVALILAGLFEAFGVAMINQLQ